MSSVESSLDQEQYLTFYVGEEEYATSIMRVKEIIEYDTLTKVPTTPIWIRGVINLRGSVVPVVDLAAKFGLGESAATQWSCIVVVETEFDGEQMVMGVMVDSVSQVMELSAEDIEPPPAFGTRVRVDYLLGMGKVGKKFVLILDIDRVLSIDELLTMISVKESAGEEESAFEGSGVQQQRIAEADSA